MQRALAIDINGKVTVYDTEDHRNARGILTEAEFSAKKAELLGRL